MNPIPSSRTPTMGGRVQRDVRLQAALALVIGIAVVAVPLFIWGRGKKKSGTEASASVSASAEDAGPPTVVFGDAGATVSVDAGGRALTFGEPRYLRCQDPGPSKTPAEKCDHLGALEELVTKAIAERAATCFPAAGTAQSMTFAVDVSFKRKKMKLHDAKEGSSIPAAKRKGIASCVEKSLGTPNWDTLPHAHQRYVFHVMATLGPAVSTPQTSPSTGAQLPAP
ncbi:MAG: hypothetical protein IPJ34_18000 [Myxococcales bacterium]|nr:hypothetical protein [Myxococcales bacterium]